MEFWQVVDLGKQGESFVYDRTWVTKFDTSRRCGIQHYWIVDPIVETLRVHRWTPDGYLVVLNAQRGQRVRAEPFEAIELQVGVLFWDDPDEPGEGP